MVAFSVLTIDGWITSREARFTTTWNCVELGPWQHRVDLVRINGLTLHTCDLEEQR